MISRWDIRFPGGEPKFGRSLGRWRRGLGAPRATPPPPPSQRLRLTLCPAAALLHSSAATGQTPRAAWRWIRWRSRGTGGLVRVNDEIWRAESVPDLQSPLEHGALVTVSGVSGVTLQVR